MYVSLEGVIPLNSILNSIPIFYLFLKMSVKMSKRIAITQRKFLEGVKGGVKMGLLIRCLQT